MKLLVRNSAMLTERQTLPVIRLQRLISVRMISVVRSVARCFALEDTDYKAMWVVPNPRQPNKISVVEIGRVNDFTDEDLTLLDLIFSRDGNPVLVEGIREVQSDEIECALRIKNQGKNLSLALVFLIKKPVIITPEIEQTYKSISASLFWLGHIGQLRDFVLNQ